MANADGFGFNPRSHGGSDCPFPPFTAGVACFNPRSHGGSDPFGWSGILLLRQRVSIHAPTGGATDKVERSRKRSRVSIHAPTGGATHGHDHPRLAFGVSIHAPTGGATASRRPFRRIACVSIHAPTGGATVAAPSLSGRMKFQSTLPRGERHAIASRPPGCRSFNPRSHGGSD